MSRQNIRAYILNESLMLEELTSKFLIELLGIESESECRSFGNTSQSLSFNSKINLLIDIGALSNDLRTKYVTFMEIRNQFMHNLEADTYVKCFVYLEGRQKWLLKTYPQPNEMNLEKQLKLGVKALVKEIITITMEIEKQVIENSFKRIGDQIYQRSHHIMMRSLKKLNITTKLKAELQKNQVFDLKRLNGIVSAYKEAFLEKWFKEMSKNDNSINR